MTRGQAAHISSTTGRTIHSFDRWFLSVETARSLGQKLDLIHNAELAGIIVWEASLDTKNHSFAAQLRDTLLR